MPQILKAAPNTFCWVEHACGDVAAARAFYGGLFGWTFVPKHTLSDGSTYLQAQRDGASVCGFTTLQGRSVPARWLPFLAVDDARATNAAAVDGGAKSLVPVEQVPGGAYALLRDPTGAPFALWQGGAAFGPWLCGEKHALAWSELLTADLQRAAQFYTGVFKWKTDLGRAGDMPYALFSDETSVVGGMAPNGKDLPNAWVFYWRVDDADEASALATTLGAQTSVGVTDWGNVGRWALLKDPLGVTFGVMEPP